MALGLSIANDLLAARVQSNLDANQHALTTGASHLSSGLRIESAADDPSGLAVAESLRAQVGAFDQALGNVQTAGNAVQVADAALATTTEILQRIRNLAVEAASDIASGADRANLQTEVAQLILEINRISSNTNFNGATLLDGSHAGFQAQQQASAAVTANTALAAPSAQAGALGPVASYTLAAGAVSPTISITGLAPNTSYLVETNTIGGSTESPTVYDVNQGAPAGVFLVFTTAINTGDVLVSDASGTVRFTVDNSAGASAAAFSNFTVLGIPGNVTWNVGASTTSSSSTGTGSNPGMLISTVSAANASFVTTFGSGTVDGSIEVQVVNTGVSVAAQVTFINSATGAISVDSTLYGAYGVAANFDNVSVSLGGFGALDVGTTAFVKVSQNVAALSNPSNPAFAVHSGANEGDTLAIGIAATNAQTLRIANINLAISAANNPSLGAEDAIGQLDGALDRVLRERAELGAEIVRLNEDARNASVAAVNLQASESEIRDLDVGRAVTEFTKASVLVQVGTSVLAQAKSDAQSVLALFR